MTIAKPHFDHLIRLIASSVTSTALMFVSLGTATSGQMSDADFKRGQAIFEQSCADCHGEKAEGVEGVYDSALTGDLPVAELSKYVDQTMPEGAPEDCAGADAELVTAYLYQAFYSRAAQQRNNPPEIEFSRRTVRQYQNSVRDIVKAFRGVPWIRNSRTFYNRSQHHLLGLAPLNLESRCAKKPILGLECATPGRTDPSRRSMTRTPSSPGCTDAVKTMIYSAAY